MGILLEKMPFQEIFEYTGVLEKSTGTMTMYGSTATSPGSIDRQRFFNWFLCQRVSVSVGYKYFALDLHHGPSTRV